MPRLHSLVLSALAVALLPTVASAASGEIVGSGRTLDDVRALLAPYVTETSPPADGLISATQQAALDKLAERRLDARAVCRTRLRKASATTRFSILSGCVVDDLLSQKASLAELSKAITTAPATTESARLTTAQLITAERDALDALVDGIESNVYSIDADLQKARQRLVEKYSTPRWLSLTRLRADRALHWAAWLATSLETNDAGSGATLAPVDSAIITCLGTASDTLLTVTTEAHDLAAAHQRLDDGLSQLASCAP